MEPDINVKGRPTNAPKAEYVASLQTYGRSYARLRLDDNLAPDFWIEAYIPREVLVRVLAEMDDISKV